MSVGDQDEDRGGRGRGGLKEFWGNLLLKLRSFQDLHFETKEYKGS